MRTGVWLTIIVVLLVVIGVLAWFLFTTPASVKTSMAATSTSATSTIKNATSTASQPLHARVVVTSPKQNAKVGREFTVAGTAPSQWYFEATFPIQVRDINDNVIGSIGANAQGDWMSSSPVPFTATVHLDVNYSGPATLILMRDNPSGLPENDDSLEIPISIQ
jgi:uncharacterized iron-regulated membrane protein